MTNKALQVKLDKMLAKAIKDVKALDIELYDIIPTVRITKNSRRIGSAQDMNRAIAKHRGSHSSFVIAGKTPLFRISISEKECSNDYDINNVLYHEVLHCAPNCQNHQKTWKGYAARVNKVYGTNVTTTKSVYTGNTSCPNMADVKEYVGKCFKDNGKTYKFTGFNGRPKNSCDIVDVKTGRQYVCVPAYIAKMAKTSLVDNVEPVKKSTPAKPKVNPVDALKLVGRKVKNGVRGRKIFTVVSVDVNGGKKAIVLVDEYGNEYTGPLGCVRKLVVVG